MAIKKTIIVDANTKKAIKNVDNLTDSFEELEDQIEDTGDEAQKSGEDLGDGMKKGASGVKTLTVGIKAMGVALKAAGIGLIVAALSQFSTMFAGDAVADTMTTIAETMNNLFNGQGWSEALSNAKATVALRKELELSEKEFQKTQLLGQRDAEIQRQIRDDVSISIRDRIVANEKLGELLKEQLEAELALAGANARFLLQEDIKLDTQESALALADAEIKILEIRERLVSQESEQKVNAVALQRELNVLQETENTTLSDNLIIRNARNVAELTLIQVDKKRLERAFEFDNLILQNRIDKEKEGTQARADAIKEQRALNLDYQQSQIALDNELYNEKKRIVLDFADALQTVLGETSVAAKALAIAQATWNVYEGITKALTLPFPASLLAAATVGLTGFAAVKDIVDTPNPMGGNSGASGSAPTLPDLAPEFNIVGNTGVNQLAESISQQQNVPIKAFVVGKDVTTQQEMDRAIVNTATFG